MNQFTCYSQHVVYAGIQGDDIVIPEVELSSLPLFSEETVLTEKLDGANCSIYHGNVSDMYTCSCSVARSTDLSLIFEATLLLWMAIITQVLLIFCSCTCIYKKLSSCLQLYQCTEVYVKYSKHCHTATGVYCV